MPASRVKGIEIIPPVKFELVLVLIVFEDFNVIIEDIPGHISWVESLAPRVECRRPEVHPQRLGLPQEFDGI